MPLPRNPQTARRTRSFAPRTLSGCITPRAARPAPAFKKLRRFASDSIPIEVSLVESGQNLQQSLERFARAFDLIAVRPKVVRLERHGSVVMVVPQSLHLPLPIDESAAYWRPFFLAGGGVLSHILDVNVGEQPLHGFIAMGIRHLIEHRGVSGIPVAAQARRGDLFEQMPHFPAGPDIACVL